MGLPRKMKLFSVLTYCIFVFCFGVFCYFISGDLVRILKSSSQIGAETQEDTSSDTQTDTSSETRDISTATLPAGASIWVLNRPMKVVPPPVKLIIVSYRRSGSSFFGSLIHSHPDVYYIYEPLVYIQDPDTSGLKVSEMSNSINDYMHGKRDWQTVEYVPEPVDFVRSLLNCQMSNASFNFLQLGGGSRNYRDIANCLKKKSIKNKDWCFKNATAHCSTKALTSVKTVRLSLEESGRLMASDPTIKVIYLPRDPRGSRNSLILTVSNRAKSPGNVPFDRIGDKLMKEKCRIMNEDVRVLAELDRRFKGRILTVRYEDVTDDALAITEELLKFLQLDMHKDVLKSIEYMTHNPNVTNVYYSRIRTNSSQTAQMWRQQLDFEEAQKLQKECGPFMKFMKYNFFDTEEDLRDENLPFREKEYGNGILHL